MSLGKTAAMLRKSEHVERDLNAARTGERFRYTMPIGALAASGVGPIPCVNCGDWADSHIMESGIMFCAENALRERYGR